MKSDENENRVLLVVDVQNDFCPGGAPAVPGGDEVVPVVNRLSRQFAHVILTQDWHCAGHLSFASSHPGKKPLDRVSLPYGEQILWPDHCVEETPGGAVPSESGRNPLRGDHSQGLPPRDRFVLGALRE